MDVLNLHRRWTIIERIGHDGGFGRVYRVESDGAFAAAKIVPKQPGAKRELLFDEIVDARNVIPLIDQGETDDSLVLVMPLAERSLREAMQQAGGAMSTADALPVLTDIVDALVDLDGRVVHRDLKPENILYLDGHWCLADFGISRYSEASTSTATHKLAMTYAYTAPERWRFERATTAADVYSFGIIAYELLTGSLPFPGPDRDAYASQHQFAPPPRIDDVPAPLASMVHLCLLKPPEARLAPTEIRRQLEGVAILPNTGGLARLQQAHVVAARARSEETARQAEEEHRLHRLAELRVSASETFGLLHAEFAAAIAAAAPLAVAQRTSTGLPWQFEMGDGRLSIHAPETDISGGWLLDDPPFTVVAYASVVVEGAVDRYGYRGRAHSLWYCDAERENEFAWYETAFTNHVFGNQATLEPFAFDPSSEAREALSHDYVSAYKVDCPFTRLSPGGLADFIDRWATWFADAAEGKLARPPQRVGAFNRNWRG